MSTKPSVGELAINDPLDSMFENLRPIPRIEITEDGARFVSTIGEILTYPNITDALQDNPDFSGLIHFNRNFEENLNLENAQNNKLTVDLDSYEFSTDELSVCGNVTFKNGKIECDGVLGEGEQSNNINFDNVEININGNISLDGEWDVTIGSGSRVVFVGNDGREINGFKVTPNTKVTVQKDTIIQSNNGTCFLLQKDGKIGNRPELILEGGQIIGKTGIEIRYGKLDIPFYSDSTIIGHGAKTNDKPWIGSAIAVRQEVSGGDSVEFDVKSGKFISANNVPVGSYQNGSVARKVKFMNGGTLDRFPSTTTSDPDYNIIAEGCVGRTPCKIIRPG